MRHLAATGSGGWERGLRAAPGLPPGRSLRPGHGVPSGLAGPRVDAAVPARALAAATPAGMALAVPARAAGLPAPAARLAAAVAGMPVPVALAVVAVALNLLVSGNLLIKVGIPYAADGGNPLEKLHPGTYVAILALSVAVWRSPVAGLGRLARRARVPALFGLAMVGCVLFAGAMTGKARLVVFIENFMPAAMLAMLLRDAGPRAMRCLGLVILGLLALNVVLSVPETLLHRHLVPVALNAGEVEHEVDFRPTALFDHPLTGAMMAMIGLFLAASPWLRTWQRWPLMALMGLGLLSFGGRTALVLSALLFVGWQGAGFVRRLLARRLTPVDVLVVPALVVLLPLLAAVVLTQTSLGERIATHFYWDESAQVRSVQWNMLGMLEPREALFGMTLEAQERATHQLGLAWRIQVIENFWLLLYLYLGAVGFALFATGFLAMMAWTFRQGSVPGRLMLVGVILAASTSNSLGRKANILTVLVPAVMASAALAQPRARRPAPPSVQPRLRVRG